jgi:CRISPR-associated protein Cmr1
MLITVKPLTPLWTGDAEGSGDSIRESGILGSLRWWYEALLRGNGHEPCDLGVEPCLYEPDRGQASICHACQLFGCTGYARRFTVRLINVDDNTTLNRKIENQLITVKLRNPTNGHDRGWFVPWKPQESFAIEFRPARPGTFDAVDKASILHTLRLIAQFGALGARTSQGQGIVNITCRTDEDQSDALSIVEWRTSLGQRPARQAQSQNAWPNFADFVGVHVTLGPGVQPDQNWWENTGPLVFLRDAQRNRTVPYPANPVCVPSAPAVRAELRSWLRTTANVPIPGGSIGRAELEEQRHAIMGYAKGNSAQGSNVFVSHLYKELEDNQWKMRVFAFLPANGAPAEAALRRLLQNPVAFPKLLEKALGLSPLTVASFPQGLNGFLP